MGHDKDMRVADLRLLQDSIGRYQWFRTVQWLPEVDSTNDRARQIALLEPDLLPALVIADHQTQGRGRSTHSWWSPQGCLMMTLAVPASKMPESREHWNELALLVGVAAAEAIEQLYPNLQVQLKWPNDLYLQSRKAGGILIESFTTAEQSPVFLIGIGINVAINWQAAPPELKQRATCLSTELQRTVDLTDLLIRLTTTLIEHMKRWQSGDHDWHPSWIPRCFLTGRLIRIIHPTEGHGSKNASGISGLCEGVARRGQLLIRTGEGRLLPINSGQIELINV